MRPLPQSFKTIVEQYETEIKEKFGAPFYDRLIEGKYTIVEFTQVRRFLMTLIQQ